MITHTFQTGDHSLAAKIHAIIMDHVGNAAPVTALATGTVAPPPPAAAAAPPPPPAPPPAAAAAPPPPPPAPAAAAAPPPPPPPPAAAAASTGVDPALMVAPEGWTIDHVKSAANSFTQKHGSGGAAKLAEMLGKYCAPGTAKPNISKTLPAYWANLYAELTA